MDLNPADTPKNGGEFATATARIDAKREGMRMQEALVGLFPHWLPSRKSCRKAIDRGEVLCDGHIATTALWVSTGQEVQLVLRKAIPIDPGPGAPRSLKMVRTPDADYVLVWKPAGLATTGSGRLTLARVLAFKADHGLEEEQTMLRPAKRDALPHPHPVHRLDRATSGWVCVALSLNASASLGQSFTERTVEKRYLALVAGTLESGSSATPIEGQSAKTQWTTLAHGPIPVHGTASLLDIRIETGRTHQIRRHLSERNHPIVGEDLYSAPGMDVQSAPRYSGSGLLLCAYALTIPEGSHGPATRAHGTVPRKFKRFRWVESALANQETEAS
jgi:23S rRNA-/tRNA-specific pseudouridylate synthase